MSMTECTKCNESVLASTTYMTGYGLMCPSCYENDESSANLRDFLRKRAMTALFFACGAFFISISINGFDLAGLVGGSIGLVLGIYSLALSWGEEHNGSAPAIAGAAMVVGTLQILAGLSIIPWLSFQFIQLAANSPV